MNLRFDGEAVRGDSQARERFYDARGYGRPHDGGVELAPVELAHLLFRGDVESVRDARPETADRLGFESLLASTAVSEVDFLVYKELRDRGFYLSPTNSADVTDFVVYPRGNGPWDDAVAYRVTALGERETVDAGTLGAIAGGTDAAADEESTGVLAVVDEESEVTYLELDEPTLAGSTYHDIPPFEGRLLSDRVLVPEPPTALHGRAFYGQRLDRDDGPVQLSLVEAAYLEREGLLALADGGTGDGDAASVSAESPLLARGREVEGERFDRRLRVYDALRTAGIVPKTGFKFGADFRTYANVESVDDLGHSEFLVRVLPPGHGFVPRDLSLDVRLAHGVRKRMLFAFAGDEGVDWLSVERLTP